MRINPKLSPQRLLALALPLIAFAALWAVLNLANGGSEPADASASSSAPDTEAKIAELERAAAAEPNDPEILAGLGNVLYQRARETGDGAYNDEAERAFRAALALDPRSVSALTGRATLALSDHRFGDGLALAREAHRIAPAVVAPYPALVDGLIETGRYGAAAQALERFARVKPGLAAYSRVSYFRELNGDLDGAAQALRLAIAAGSGTAEGSAYVRVLLANLNAQSDRYDAAARGYREALAIDPGNGDAEAGLALLSAGRGQLDQAITQLRANLGNPPSPDALADLGEVEQAAGRLDAAQRHYAASDRIERGLIEQGSGVDAAVTVFEADHGKAAFAVGLGRRAWQDAPSVSSADAYSWALFRAGRTEAAARLSAEAMRLGSRDPEFLFHAGMIARANGDRGAARRLLTSLLEQSPRFSPLYAPRAERALRSLG